MKTERVRRRFSNLMRSDGYDPSGWGGKEKKATVGAAHLGLRHRRGRPARVMPAATIVLLLSLVTGRAALAQGGGDYVVFRNFVRHSDGTFCTHRPPQASFTVFVNGDETRILTESAPRWSLGADPNIDGKGTFAVELGNFVDPTLAVGDTVYVRFTCRATGEQGMLREIVTSIPWPRFPQTRVLAPADLPAPPTDLELKRDRDGRLVLSWTPDPRFTYSVYRRSLGDTVANGKERMLYHQLAAGLSSGIFIDSTTADGSYGYIVYARSASGGVGPHSAEVNERVPGMDLDVGWISRLPRLPYVWNSEHPEREGWPKEGEAVVWRAHVKNWSGMALNAVPYRWYLDGEVVASGTIALGPGEYVTVDLPWTWTFERHRLTFEVDPTNAVAEEEERNNQLTVFTDAITVGFCVEQTVYDYFHEYQRELGVGSNSWEDWAQRHVSRWNRMFAEAVYPESPEGVLDRIRIDTIAVVPDGALPLAGGLPTNHPNRRDFTVDLQWGFPASLVREGFYSDHVHASETNPFYFEGSLLHELGHARYLIDLYGFNVHEDGTGSTVGIREEGQLVAGTAYMPIVSGAVHWTPYRGLMNGQYTFVDRYSAAALNLIAGHRATLGNYNAPGNIGVFLQDLPPENVLHLKDQRGRPLHGARVEIYQALGKPGEWYGKFYDDEPELVLYADSTGAVDVGRCPFSSDGHIVHTYGWSNGVAVLRVEQAGRVGYGFLEVTDFNLAYWRGDSIRAEYELTINMLERSTGVRIRNPSLPTAFRMGPCFPNPFREETAVRLALPASARVVVEVYDVRGRRLRVLERGMFPAGEYRLAWDGKDATGVRQPAGVYVIRARLGERVFVRKTVRLP